MLKVKHKNSDAEAQLTEAVRKMLRVSALTANVFMRQAALENVRTWALAYRMESERDATVDWRKGW